MEQRFLGDAVRESSLCRPLTPNFSFAISLPANSLLSAARSSSCDRCKSDFTIEVVTMSDLAFAWPNVYAGKVIAKAEGR